MKVFVAGPRVVTRLDELVRARLDSVVDGGHTVLVGDANGVDRLVQQRLAENGCPNVLVYASNGVVRNNLGAWPVRTVPVDKGLRGFAFYACKDRQMAQDADYGLMIWNGKSRGTLRDIMDLAQKGKKVALYYIPHRRFYCIANGEEVQTLVKGCGEAAEAMYAQLKEADIRERRSAEMGQLALF